MKPISTLEFGFSDAENYNRRENKDLFNKIFVKNIYLEQLLRPNTFFLMGEKGTGKTAYAVFLSNNDYKDTVSILKYIRETDYQKFVTLKKEKHLQLSDYTSIWKVIILLLLSQSIDADELDHNPFSRNKRLKAIRQAIDEYYKNAFAPEIIYALNLIENTTEAAELISKYLKMGEEHSLSSSFQESKFQVNLLFIQNQFEKALSDIKIKENHLLFIDGIDIRPGRIPYGDYLDCIKGLANAIWSINNDFFSKIRDSKGRFRVVLLMRPDIFNSIGLQNQTNKVQDNSVLLEWRTTYPEYRSSYLFEMADKILSSQQDMVVPTGKSWDYYLPWKSSTTSPDRRFDDSFIHFLRISYSRPRDIVAMLKILQKNFSQSNKSSNNVFSEKDFNNKAVQNTFSEYLMGGIKDQLSFYYSDKHSEMFLHFFEYLKGRIKFNYADYMQFHDLFIGHLASYNDGIPEFIRNPDTFLQFLYDTNIICYIEMLDTGDPLFRWCYRERNQANICPKVKKDEIYMIHYGLAKSLNVGHRELI